MTDSPEATAAQDTKALAGALDDAIWTSEGSIPLEEIEAQHSLAEFLREHFEPTTRRSA
mgnify:CR=1 FL=1